jgi:ribosome recycling factor
MVDTIDTLKRETAEKMQKLLQVLQKGLAGIQTGRASPGFLDGVEVLCSEQRQPLKCLASVKVEDARTLVVTPFDKSSIAAIEKAIHLANLGVNPIVTKEVLRLPLPPLTEERRLALVKQVKELAEQAKIEARNHRRDANQKVKTLVKQQNLSNDLVRAVEQHMQKITDEIIVKIDKIVVEKERELMHV